MNEKWILIIIVLVLILVILGIICYAYTTIRNKIRYYSRQLLGTSSLMKGLQTMERETDLTPRSVSGATSLYLPKIVKDFPEFHYDEMKVRAENVLLSYLRSVDQEEPDVLVEGTDELKENLQLRIQGLKIQGQREHFKQLRIHRTEIYQYRKGKGRCSILFQSAVEGIHYIEKSGQILTGKTDHLEQSKYNVEVVYIQDRELVEAKEMGLGLNCPNCGAPLSALGAKTCLYCDTPVREINIHSWNFSAVTEQGI